MELKHYLRIIRKWLWLIALATGIAVGVSYYALSQQPNLYQASAKLLVGQSLQNANPSAQDLNTSQQLALTYIQIAQTQPVLEATINALQLDMSQNALAGRFNASIIQGTQIIEIRVVDTDPARAQAIANELAYQLTLQGPNTEQQDQSARRDFIQQQVDELQKKIQEAQLTIADLQKNLQVTGSAREIADTQLKVNTLQGQIAQWQQTYASMLAFLTPRSPNYLSIIEPASLPRFPMGPNLNQSLLIAAAIGLLVGLSGAFLLEYLDDKIKTPEQVSALLQLPTIGSIGRIPHANDRKLITVIAPRSPISEAYRVLRTNIEYTSLDKPIKSILVTSPGQLEGKSVTAANLAIALALVGRRTILVDADFRKPAQHRFFNVNNDIGLTNALVAQLAPDKFIRQTHLANLRLLTTGPSLPNPAEAIASERMRTLVAQLQTEADTLVFDTPPCLPVADPAILARLTDGTILVIDSGRTHREAAIKAKEIMEKAGSALLGVVLNRYSPQSHADQYYSLYYGSQSQRQGSRKKSATPQPVVPSSES